MLLINCCAYIIYSSSLDLLLREDNGRIVCENNVETKELEHPEDLLSVGIRSVVFELAEPRLQLPEPPQLHGALAGLRLLEALS